MHAVLQTLEAYEDGLRGCELSSILHTAVVTWSLRSQNGSAGEVKLKLECVILQMHLKKPNFKF